MMAALRKEVALLRTTLSAVMKKAGDIGNVKVSYALLCYAR
jgi:hypothetical protein